MKSTILLSLLILVNTSITAKDKISNGINEKLKVKSGQRIFAGLGTYYYEGFDEYFVDNYLAFVDENWSTWSNDPGGPEDGKISNEQALSESNSVKVDGSTDLILPMGEKINGNYVFNFNVFIPTGNAGYFNISHYDTPDIDFAFHCAFKSDEQGNGIGIVTADGQEIGFIYNHDEWVNVNLMVDLDNDLSVLAINQETIHTWQWSLTWEGVEGKKQLGCLDIYANDFDGTQTALMYFDDVLLFKTETQQISLYTGWNIVSMNVLPENENMMNIFQALISTGSLIKIQNEGGYSLEKILGDWKNNIGDIALTEGYKIKVNADDLIEISGTKVNFPYAIPLKMGWNIIGYPQSTAFNGLAVVQQLIDRNSLIKVQDEAGYSIEYLSIFNDWTNNIGNFLAGEGYKIKVSKDDTLWITDSDPKAATFQPERNTATHFIPSFKGNGTDHMNIHLFNLAESGIMEGDEIGVFDGKVCVGSARIIQHSAFNIQHSSINIPVSANDGKEDKNGFSDGNQIILKLYRNGCEYSLTIETQKNCKAIFEKGNSLFAKVNVDLNTGNSAFPKGLLVNCYPNPFSDKLNFEFVSVNNAHAVLEIQNLLGQTVSTLLDQQIEGGVMNRIEYGPTNIVSGVYLYKLTIESNASVGKIIYIK